MRRLLFGMAAMLIGQLASAQGVPEVLQGPTISDFQRWEEAREDAQMKREHDLTIQRNIAIIANSDKVKIFIKKKGFIMTSVEVVDYASGRYVVMAANGRQQCSAEVDSLGMRKYVILAKTWTCWR